MLPVNHIDEPRAFRSGEGRSDLPVILDSNPGMNAKNMNRFDTLDIRYYK
jgi:hypothetical protein